MSRVLLHRVQAGETLPSISLEYYGTQKFGPAIYDANRHAIGTNPNALNPGADLVIPRIGVLGGIV